MVRQSIDINLFLHDVLNYWLLFVSSVARHVGSTCRKQLLLLILRLIGASWLQVLQVWWAASAAGCCCVLHNPVEEALLQDSEAGIDPHFCPGTRCHITPLAGLQTVHLPTTVWGRGADQIDPLEWLGAVSCQGAPPSRPSIGCGAKGTLVFIQVRWSATELCQRFAAVGTPPIRRWCSDEYRE